MPVNLAWIDLNYIAGPDAPTLAVSALHAAFAGCNQKHLPPPVAVPVGACPRVKQDRSHPYRRLSLAGHDWIRIDDSGERFGERF